MKILMSHVRFVCDQIGSEDLAPVPASEWVIASGKAANGVIRLINVRNRTTTTLFPAARGTPLEDRLVNALPGGHTHGTGKETGADWLASASLTHATRSSSGHDADAKGPQRP